MGTYYEDHDYDHNAHIAKHNSIRRTPHFLVFNFVQCEPPESRLEGRSRQNRRRGKLTKKISKFYKLGEISYIYDYDKLTYTYTYIHIY